MWPALRAISRFMLAGGAAAAFSAAGVLTDPASASIVVGSVPQTVADRYVPEPPGFVTTSWVDGLEAPWALVFLPDGRALVSERAGRIRLIENGVLRPEPLAVLDVMQRIEGGLMGLALHPRYPAQPYLYAMATVDDAAGPVNRVVRLRIDGARARFDRIVLDGIPAGARHNGGRIAFGPDGMLYVGTGETTQRDLAQDRSSLAGKILRMTPDGAPAPDNPIRGSPVYTLGHRNVQGFAWHPVTRDLFASEHGPSSEDGLKAYDEINLIRKSRNYGWPIVVGAPAKRGLTDPIATWSGRSVPPSGMTFWHGDLFVATLGAEALLRIRVSRNRNGYRVESIDRWFNDGAAGRYGRLRDAVVGPDDALYVLNNKLDGGGDPKQGDDRILRISVRE